MMIFSLAWSTSVTKSFYNFLETRTDSTSKAARLMIEPAARAALMAILSMGWMEDEEAVMVMRGDSQACVERKQAASNAKKHARLSGRRQ